MMATYKEIFDLHVQLLRIYEKNENYQGPYQKQINYFKRQLFLTEDIVQRIFVLNQLIKIHEKGREENVKWCAEEYFK
ncbi:hypothetical protein [Paenibacillus phytohabitans]|uniref:hypothetical protein n=1 Tax=Paenibacillus phytohabitans TaxID=2654978 RepID=UPI00300A6109